MRSVAELPRWHIDEHDAARLDAWAEERGASVGAVVARVRSVSLRIRAQPPQSTSATLERIVEDWPGPGGEALADALRLAIDAFLREDLAAAGDGFERAMALAGHTQAAVEIGILSTLCRDRCAAFAAAGRVHERLRQLDDVSNEEQRGRRDNNYAIHSLYTGHVARAVELAAAAVARRRRRGGDPNLSSSVSNLGLALASLGDLEGALASHREAVELERRSPNRREQLYLVNLGRTLALAGDLEGARDTMRAAEARGSSNPYDVLPGVVHLAWGEVHQLSGEHAAAEARLREALDSPAAVVRAEAGVVLLEVLLALGRPDEARAFLAGFDRSESDDAEYTIRLAIVEARLHGSDQGREAARAHLERADDLAARLDSWVSWERVDAAWRSFHEARGELEAVIGRLDAGAQRRTAHQRHVLHTRLARSRVEQEIAEACARADAAESARAELQLAYQRLQEAQEARRRAMGIVVHDLRNPLTAILGQADALYATAESEGNAELLEDAERIVAAALRMQERIDALLASETLEERQPRRVPGGVSLLAVLAAVERDLGHLAAAKDQRLEVLTAADVPRAEADPAMLRDILENLLTNAIKFSPPGALLTLRALEVEGRPAIEVQDEGPGFSEADRRAAFERFARLSARPTGGESSTGLGLYSVKVLCDKLGATVAVVSPPGPGACLRVVLRAATPT